jgi:oligoribonuclease (3'-5' exoribonuclease)
MAKEYPEFIYWLDLETTGLDPRAPGAAILEVAIARAPLREPFAITVLWNYPLYFSREQAAALAEGDPFVFDMHTRNGLLRECEDAKAVTTGAVERALCEAGLAVPSVIIPATPKGEHPPVLAGSSVHFDHAWLQVHMPTLAARFSYRYLDVSAVKLECISQGMAPLPKAGAHRALADIRESMLHLERCRAWQASRVEWAKGEAYDRGLAAARATLLGAP